MSYQQIPIAEAARLTGRDRKSLYRDIKAGKLSATLGDSGTRQVAVSELLRVYGPFRSDGDTGDSPATVAVPQDATPEATALQGRIDALQTEVEYLRERLADKDKNLDDLRTTIRLLVYKKEPQPAPVGFWKRLFGKTKRPKHE